MHLLANCEDGVMLTEEQAAELRAKWEAIPTAPLPVPPYVILPSEEFPPDEVWLVEPLTPLQQAAGFTPRVVGKIVNIGEE